MQTKQSFLTSLLIMLVGLLPLTVQADDAVQLAKWTFETGYTVADGVYTPNTEDWAQVGSLWFQDGQPKIIANEAVGNESDYVVTGKTSRYWQLCSGWNNHVFRIVNDTESNNITDVTDGSVHDNYYEVQFPTKGYKNVKLALACAYGGNAEAAMAAVYSTDGGTTWKKAGEYTTAGTWWTYNDGSIDIPAVDKEKVIVRLIFGNGLSSNWNLDYVTITGEAFTADPNAIEIPATTDALDLTKATMSSGKVKDDVDVPQFDSVGDKGTATFTLNNTVEGAVYKITLGAATNNANNTLRLVITDNATGATELDKTINVTANGWQAFNTYDVTTGQLAEGEKTFVINFLSGQAYTSNVNNIKFEKLDVADLLLISTAVSPAGAGIVNSSAAAVAKGEDVTLTATANKGYAFEAWVDADGNELSTENPATITVNEALNVTGKFKEIEILNVIPTTEETPWVMENGTLNGSRASFGTDHHIDWMNNGDNAVYKLDNKIDAQYYDVQFTAGTQQSNVSINVQIVDAEGHSVCDQTVDIENNGNWASDSKTYSFRTGEMLKGRYVMTVNFYSVGGNGTTANINNFSFTGKEKFVAETVNNQKATITFKFDEGNDGQVATFSEGAEGWFKSNYTQLGSNVYYNGVSLNQSKINPSVSNESSANDGNAVSFYLIPTKGLTFTPTKVSFNTTRYGTNGGKTDVTWVNSDGSTVAIESGMQSAKNNDVTEYSKEITDATASDALCGLRLNLYSLLDTKQVGYGNIVIEGTVNGTTEDVAHYTLSAAVSDEAAGKVTIIPNADVFDEGDEVTLSASENFGYHFEAWVDAEGNELSTQNPFTFNIADDTNLTARYTKSNTYELKLTLTEGAQPNLVQIVPEGTMINGKRMYEEGTDVKLTAVNNKILTFVGWENNSTDMERDVKMDADQTLTANFSAVDYIVGWDLYYDQPAKDRAADYKADTENSGMLSLRKADGTTQGWLTRGISNGFEGSRPGGRIWKLRSEGYYFEISFSSKGYSNLKLSNGMGVSYNTYKNFDVEYSVDGTNFTKFGEFAGETELQPGWVDGEFDLPEEANDQNRVYIRWKGVESSGLVGASTDYDGLCIGNIFVTADAEGAADEKATLVSSNPETGAEGASANGSVILNFDKKVKAGTGVATLDGEEITPIISGKSAVFKYSGLKYNTQYTFTMPKGVLTSRSGNDVDEVVITFTTMERTQPEKRVYDAIVAQDGSGDYTTVQDAIDAAPEGRSKPWLIFIKNGQYKEHVDIPAKKTYLHLIGQSRDGVVIKDDRLSGGDNAVHVSVGATVVVNANNTFFESLTMENIYGHEKQDGPQALALNTGGDRIALNNVALLSYQDTWITTSTSNNRHYIKNSLIEGAVDFIYNSGNVYLDGDTLEINRPSGGYIVAPSHGADVKWGYVFQNNVLRAHPGVNVTDIWLGRPWHNMPKTVFINLQTFINIPAKGWYETMGGLPVLWADYNTVDANGNPVDLSQREDTYYYTQYYKMVDGEKVIATSRPDASDMPNWTEEKVYGTAKNYLTDEEAAQYTIKNVMGGDDNWQPDLLCEATEAPAPVFNDNTISWDEVPYAICYVVTRGDEVVAITTETSVDLNAVVSAKGSAALGANDSEEPYKVQSVNEQGGLSKFGIATDATALNAVSAAKGAKSNVYYNIAGQRVNSSFKGLVISDGKKYMK